MKISLINNKVIEREDRENYKVRTEVKTSIRSPNLSELNINKN